MARNASGAQRDLFAVAGTTNSWPPEAERELLAILEKLLLEGTTEAVAPREAGDEQDHA